MSEQIFPQVLSEPPAFYLKLMPSGFSHFSSGEIYLPIYPICAPRQMRWQSRYWRLTISLRLSHASTSLFRRTDMLWEQRQNGMQAGTGVTEGALFPLLYSVGSRHPIVSLNPTSCATSKRHQSWRESGLPICLPQREKQLLPAGGHEKHRALHYKYARPWGNDHVPASQF